MLNLPVSRFQLVTELANDRLKDKTVIVRRNAMILLKGCLEENPFSGSLDPQPYEKKFKVCTCCQCYNSLGRLPFRRCTLT